MNDWMGGSKKEKLAAFSVGLVGMCLLVLAFWRGPVFHFQDALLAIVLIGAIALADRYPIHIRYATKASMISVPLFLCAALLPTPLAMLAAAAGMFRAAWLTRKDRGLLPIDFISDPARWIINVFLTSSIIGLAPAPLFWHWVMLLPAAAVMFCADILIFSLLTSLTTGEPVLFLVKHSANQIIVIEGIQYLIGILGSIAYAQAFWSLALLFVPTYIAYRVLKNIKEMDSGTRAMLIDMADTIDLRDQYTGGHSRRVAEYTALILRAMNISGAEADLILTAARLHDIGKLTIPDSILLKSGDFSAQEWQVMQSHSEKSSILLSRYADFARGASIVLSHHERWDGQGYPHGLRDYEIPLGARIIAVGDAFDAMTTDRPYRPAKSTAQAIEILREGRGTQWDPEVVATFVAAIKAIPPETETAPQTEQ